MNYLNKEMTITRWHTPPALHPGPIKRMERLDEWEIMLVQANNYWCYTRQVGALSDHGWPRAACEQVEAIYQDDSQQLSRTPLFICCRPHPMIQNQTYWLPA